METAIRFKHRLVAIHLFPNGNGRHSRLMGEILLRALGSQQVLSWGRTTLRKEEEPKLHLQALKAADLRDINSLLSFSVS
ncbi:MAG: hypothetical protein AAF433_14040 [Bacteroidota bacterium]